MSTTIIFPKEINIKINVGSYLTICLSVLKHGDLYSPIVGQTKKISLTSKMFLEIEVENGKRRQQETEGKNIFQK